MHLAATARDSPLLVGNLSVRQDGAKLPFHGRGEADFLSSLRVRARASRYHFPGGYLKRHVDLIAPVIYSYHRVAVRDTPAKCYVALTPRRCAEFYHIVGRELVEMPGK